MANKPKQQGNKLKTYKLFKWEFHLEWYADQTQNGLTKFRVRYHKPVATSTCRGKACECLAEQNRELEMENEGWRMRGYGGKRTRNGERGTEPQNEGGGNGCRLLPPIIETKRASHSHQCSLLGIR